jgi:hypothetical protein
MPATAARSRSSGSYHVVPSDATGRCATSSFRASRITGTSGGFDQSRLHCPVRGVSMETGPVPALGSFLVMISTAEFAARGEDDRRGDQRQPPCDMHRACHSLGPVAWRRPPQPTCTRRSDPAAHGRGEAAGRCRSPGSRAIIRLAVVQCQRLRCRPMAKCRPERYRCRLPASRCTRREEIAGALLPLFGVSLVNVWAIHAV